MHNVDAEVVDTLALAGYCIFVSVFHAAFPAFCLSNGRPASGIRNTRSKGSQDTVNLLLFPRCCKSCARSRIGFPLVGVTEEVSRAERRLLPQDDPARQPPCFSLISNLALDRHPPTTLPRATKERLGSLLGYRGYSA